MVNMMKNAGINPRVLIPIICVLLSASLAWAAWNTVLTTGALPAVKFEQHVIDVNKKFVRQMKNSNDQFIEILNKMDAQNIRVENKLDSIQEKL